MPPTVFRAPSVVLAALLATLGAGCPGRPDGAKPPPVERGNPLPPRAAIVGPGFRLSDADGNEGMPRTPAAPTTALSADETAQLLARLPPLPVDTADTQAFALRPKSIPAPRPGETVTQSFPPAPSTALPPTSASTGTPPLHVVRHEPDGEVPVAPYLALTFDAPMVPVTSHGDLAALPVPVKLSPAPPGAWRWVGTQTAMFQPEGRFPQATDYAVDVDSGTKSATGGVLASAEHFRFSTPPPKVTEQGPSGSAVTLEPVIYARFDQQIDPQALLATMTVTENGQAVKLRLATDEEQEGVPELAQLLTQRQDSASVWLGIGDHTASHGGQYSGPQGTRRVVAVKPLSPLAASAAITVTFPVGTPAVEGPKKTTHAQTFSFHTHGPLKAVHQDCYGCGPTAPFVIEYSNPLDLKVFDKKWVGVSPPIPDVAVSVYGTNLSITGQKKGNTRYTVTVAKALTDSFGQTLAQDDVHSFNVGPAEAEVFREQQPVAVVDPGAASPELLVFSVNEPTLHVRLYSVTPEDYAAYEKWRQSWDWEGKSTTPPGKLVVDRVITAPKGDDELVTSRVDLRPALTKDLGQVLAIVESPHPAKNRWDRRWMRQWLQVTRIGLEAASDATDLVVWATSLQDGSPFADVVVSAAGKSTTSGSDGLARLAAGDGSIVARKNGDVTFLAHGVSPNRYHPSATRFFTFDDRGIYKPGEEVHVKGWVRDVGFVKGGDVGLLPDTASKTVHWVARDPRGAELSKGDAPLNAQGGFDFVATTPKNANLGSSNIALEIVGGGNEQHGSHTFQIQEFRRPEFEVSASMSEGPALAGEHATATVSAKYYAGGGLPNADVTWTVRRDPGTFVPPNQRDYTFGKQEWTRWEPSGTSPRRNDASWTGHTDSRGAHRLRVDFETDDPPYPVTIDMSASVMDVNRQAWAASTHVLVHPASVYVGVKLARPFLKAGEKIEADTIVVDLEGKPVRGRPVSVKSARLLWEQTSHGYEEKEVDEEACPVTSTEAAVRCALRADKGGEYRIKALVEDARGRKSQTVTRVWVLGKGAQRSRNLSADAVEIQADKKTYAVGDTAELLVVAPFVPAEGMLVVARQGILSVERFKMTSSMQTLTVKIDDTLTPNVHAFVFLAGAAVRDDETGAPNDKLRPRPAYAHGEIDLSVPPVTRTLTVGVTPRDRAVAPGGHTVVDVEVKDARGGAVAGAEVAVVVVDEAILALSGYALPDPLDAFYPRRAAGVNHDGTRQIVTLAKEEDTRSRGPSPPREGVSLESAPPPPPAGAAPMASAAPVALAREKTAPARNMPTTPIAVRSDFSALALFEAAKVTDAQGHVALPVKLPDSLTRYRVMAIAVADGNHFGSHESTLTVRLPLMVRPSAPRFLSFGDAFDLPVVLQNQTDKPMNVEVAVRAHNARITEGAGKRALIPANDRIEVRFHAETTVPGKARFELAAATEDATDAATVELPVWMPATTEAFATYGVIDQGAIAQPVKMPSGVFTQFGGLEVTTSSTALQGLTDAVVYLVTYPFECNEQLASRMLAIASLRDVLTAFDSKDLPAPAELQSSVKEDLAKLKSRQKRDGGWAFWWGEEWPFVSIHVAHAIARVEAKGYPVDAGMKQRALAYLRAVEGKIPGWYDPESRRAIVAYSLYVRRLLKDADPGRAKRLIHDYGGVDKMNAEAVGWIWPTLSEDRGSAAENAKIRRFVGNRVSETAGTAHFVTSYGDGDYLLLHSDRRADAILLEAMIVDEPSSDLIPKVVKGLLGHRTAGRWESTQENAFVLLALDRYFEKFEGTTPSFVARVWLGDTFAGDHTFNGRSTAYGETDVPMSFLADVKSSTLTLSKEGAGRLYYRIGMQYAPTDLRPPPMERGFTVTRTYEPVGDAGDVRKDADGVWHFKAGAQVRVRVTMLAPARRNHVALVDPLPAGLEPMNPALLVTGTITHDPAGQKGPASRWGWTSTWYEHQNMRDERVEAFASTVWEGVHEYVYTARATTPGTFVASPPKAEEMYSPEVFGRGSGDEVVVE